MQTKESIVILTGAGISAESGIATFRALGGLWEQEPIENVATYEGYEKDAHRVHSFYNKRRQQLLDPSIAPNAAHFALAKLEQEYQGAVLVVTQNIDDLHERAGTQNLIHMHGELLKCQCEHCLTVKEIREDCFPETSCTHCGATGKIRPHIVWFGEEPFQMEDIYDAFLKSKIFVSIGTSGQVYPAAGLAHLANQNQFSQIIEINLEESSVANEFKDRRYGKATELVPQLVDEILAS